MGFSSNATNVEIPIFCRRASEYDLTQCHGTWCAISRQESCTSSPSPVIGGSLTWDLPPRGKTSERSLKAMRRRYGFFITAYVVMPEHLHLLVSEPRRVLLSKAIQSLELSVAVQLRERPFWQPRCYDFNVFSERKCLEKRRYIHRNPVSRGLVEQPIDRA